MIKSFANKLLKDSFLTNYDERKKQIDLKKKELNNLKSPKLNRTRSVQNANLLLSNRDKTTVFSKDRQNQKNLKDFSSLKKGFHTEKTLKINTIKSAKNLSVRKVDDRLKLKSPLKNPKSLETKTKKEIFPMKRESRNSSYSSLNDKVSRNIY